MEDELIVLRAIKGDDEAFLQLIHLHKAALYKTAVAYLKNEHDAIEAIQEVTVRAYLNIGKIREPAYVKTWLIRIMINYCNDVLKQKSKLLQNEQVLEVQAFNENENLFEIIDALDRLDNQAKEIITLKYFHDLKIKDIAAQMNRPESTIKTWINRALCKLRKHLEEKGDE